MENGKTESKRGRVRRLLLEPMQQAGFHFKRGMPEASQVKALDRMADALGYLSDTGLVTLRSCLMTKGEGSARTFWPGFATVVGFADAFHPRPLEEVPELLRWFRSTAGRAALEGDRLVAEFMFWQKKKRPPLSDADHKRVNDRAAEWNRRREVILDRQARNVGNAPDDQAWLAWYDALHQRVSALVADGQGKAA